MSWILYFISESLFNISDYSLSYGLVSQVEEMPTTALTHDQNRSKVCAVCYCRSGNKASREVSEKQEKLIKDLVCLEFSRTDSRFPSGICMFCVFSLLDIEKGKNPKTRTKNQDNYSYQTQIHMKQSWEGSPDQVLIVVANVESAWSLGWMD